MILIELIFQFTFIISLFYGGLEIHNVIITKTREHANSFRMLTQSTLLEKRPEKITFFTKKASLTKKSGILKSQLIFKENTYQKKTNEKKYTAPNLLNQKGEIHLFSSMLFLLLLMSTFYVLLTQFKQTRYITERKNHYLCLKSFIHLNYKYTEQMGNLNKVISINYPLQFNPKTGPIHKGIIKASKISQEVLTKKFHFDKIKRLNYCEKKQRLLFLNLYHYQEDFLGLIKRDIFERAIPREQNYTTAIYSKRIQNDLFNITFLPLSIHAPVKTKLRPLKWVSL